MAIEWNYELLTTGSSEIDEDHKEWIRRFNQFDDAVVNKRGTEAISETLRFFAQYSENHFPHEEILMEQYKCPSAEINRVEHDQFRERLRTLETWIQSEGISLVEVIELKLEMEQWLINHISKVDIQLRAVAGMDETLGQGDGEEDTLAQQKEIATAIIESSPDVIVIVNDKGQIVYVNGRCEGLLGFEAKELLGKNVEVLVPSQYSEHARIRSNYLKDPTPRAMSTRPVLSIQHKSGHQIPVDISLSPLPPINGHGNLVQAVLRDAMPRWNTQQNLLVQSVAMNAAANGIVITDLNGIIEWVNPAVTRMTGYSRTELTGSHTRILKSGKHDPVFYQSIWQTVLAGKIWFGEIVNRRKDGTFYYEEQHISPVRNEQGQIVRLIAIKQDVTARKMAEKALEESNREQQKQLVEIERLATLLSDANQALEVKVKERTLELAATNAALVKANEQLMELDDLKSSFLGVISHELRTPIVNVQFSMQLIENRFLEGMPPEQSELFQQLSANVRAANGMIDNLVNYAAFVRKQGVMKLTAVQLGAIVKIAMLVLERQAERKKLTLTLDIPDDLPETFGDEERLADAIHELVENAIKFTPSGGRVSLRGWLEESMIHFEVEDTGLGIPAEKLSSLWESFSQMADPIRRGREGLGLGLALVKYIIEAHKGDVWAESKMGVGSTFGFRLPVNGI